MMLHLYFTESETLLSPIKHVNMKQRTNLNWKKRRKTEEKKNL